MRLRTDSELLGVTAREKNIIAIWFKAVRFHYVPPSFLPAILCSIVAWSSHYTPDIRGFLLVVAGVTINHFGLNLLDDVCDYKHAVDGMDRERNPYTGGSGVLTEGLLTPRQVAIGAVVCFLITAAIGVYLAATHGWPVLALGLFGGFCSVFYTLPPVKFGYRGLGELGLLVNFGPIIGLGAYYVQARTIAVEPLIVSLVLGLMMWSMIIINEIPDYDADRSGGKWNLVARFGRRRGVILYIVGLALAYGVLISAVFTGFTPSLALIGLVSLPFALTSVKVLTQNYLEKMKMVPANLAMIKVHFFTGLGLIVAYTAYWVGNGFLTGVVNAAGVLP